MMVMMVMMVMVVMMILVIMMIMMIIVMIVRRCWFRAGRGTGEGPAGLLDVKTLIRFWQEEQNIMN